VQLYTVPGQVFYDATRKLVLRGADGVVFVADSQVEMKESNLDSLENLRTNLRLNRIDPGKVALVYQLNKRDLPNVETVEEMTSYLGATPSSVVEASAKTGVGVTATLRNAVAKILDNLKNNVDTTLYDEPALTAPDMTQKSGVAQHSAGTPKLSMRGETPTPAPVAPVAEFAPVDADPFDTDGVQVHIEEEDDPFAHVVSPEADTGTHIDFEDPFASPAAAEHSEAETQGAHDDRSELHELLANARAIVTALEAALEHARENERVLNTRLGH
jgi:hypothetical protein